MGISGPSVSASFSYDGLGRREERNINGSLTRFLYDDQNPVQESSNSTVTARVFTTPAIDAFLTRTESASGLTSVLLGDAQGSVVAVAADSGTITTEYTYEPFGRITLNGTSQSNPYQYTGRENDGVGLYYYRARYYDPVLSRFTTEDPFLAGDTLNSMSTRWSLKMNPGMLHEYVYVLNNPMTLIDPLGLAPTCYGTWTITGDKPSFFDNNCFCYWKCIDCYGNQGPTGVTLGFSMGGGIRCWCSIIPGPEYSCENCQLTPRAGGPIPPPKPQGYTRPTNRCTSCPAR